MDLWENILSRPTESDQPTTNQNSYNEKFIRLTLTTCQEGIYTRHCTKCLTYLMCDPHKAISCTHGYSYFMDRKESLQWAK